MIHQNLPTVVSSPELFVITSPFQVIDCVLGGDQVLIMTSPPERKTSSSSSSSLVSPTSPSSSVATDNDAGDVMIDASLAEAAITAAETGSLMPLIKEELKCTIQSKRLFQGKEELHLDQPKIHLVGKLTPEQEKRLQRRRERNKIAAQKCRQRRRQLAEKLQRESETLENNNSELQTQIECLKEEKRKLLNMLEKHDKSTQCGEKMYTDGP